ncbi:hypothetical protein Tco_1063728 [Tanacetum coccineum]
MIRTDVLLVKRDARPVGYSFGNNRMKKLRTERSLKTHSHGVLVFEGVSQAGARKVSGQAAGARKASSQSGGSSQPSASQSTATGARSASSQAVGASQPSATPSTANQGPTQHSAGPRQGFQAPRAAPTSGSQRKTKKLVDL